MVKLIENNTIKNKKNTIYYLILALIPILSLYELIPLINLGYMLVIIAFFVQSLRKSFKIEVNFKILIIMTIFIVINLVVGITKYSDFTNTFNNTFGMLLFTILAVFICIPKTININYFYKATKFIGLIATFFLWYQFFAFNSFDTVVKGSIPFLTPGDLGFTSIEYGRPTSFFLEPAHYALYISPIYAMSIIRKEYIVSTLLFLGLIFSTATTGLILAIISPLLIKFDFRSKKNIAIILITILFLQPLISLFSENTLSKLTIDSWSSNSRIFGTLYVFNYFSISEWIAGIGINRMTDYLGPYMNTIVGNYANSIIFFVISFGIIGLTIFLVSLFYIYKKIHKKYRVLWIILILTLASDQILFNRNLLYLLIWQYAAFNKNDSSNELL